MSLINEMETAAKAVKAMGEQALKYYQTDVDVSFKGGHDSPVSIADYEAEKAGFKTISREFPDDSFLGEEGLDQTGSSDRYWVLDSIDGTLSFLGKNHQGCGLWPSLIS